MHTVDMVASAPGGSVIQCRVGDHIAAGMRLRYKVEGSTDTLEMRVSNLLGKH